MLTSILHHQRSWRNSSSAVEYNGQLNQQQILQLNYIVQRRIASTGHHQIKCLEIKQSAVSKKRKLLIESQLTLARVTEIVVTMEMTTRDANNLRISSGTKVNRIHSKKNSIITFRKSVPRTNASEKCYHCDEALSSDECRFKNATCHSS